MSKPKTNGIKFARGLSSRELVMILQHELLRARSTIPESQVHLPTELVHDIKFRLEYYARAHGEIDRKDDNVDT